MQHLILGKCTGGEADDDAIHYAHHYAPCYTDAHRYADAVKSILVLFSFPQLLSFESYWSYHDAAGQ